jgi:hypothetical protein
MDKPPPRLPLHLLILLGIFACGLVVHFMAESLGPNSNPAVVDLVRHGGHAQADQECGEDDFVFSSLACISAEFVAIPPASLRTAPQSFIPISPLLPPPNS